MMVESQPRGVVVLVPVKAFSKAKMRLAGTLSGSERVALSQWMAGRVLRAAAPLPAFVLCDSEEVRIWARENEIQTIDCPQPEESPELDAPLQPPQPATESAESAAGTKLEPALNRAAQHGFRTAGELGFDRVIIAHADLPFAENFDGLADAGRDILIVPDRHEAGTTAISLPASCDFHFAYGKDSFSQHLKQAEMLSRANGFETKVVRDEQLSWDVDQPDDLEAAPRFADLGFTHHQAD